MLGEVERIFGELGMILSTKRPIVADREVEFLGFKWDAQRKTLSVTEQKCKKYRKEVENLLRQPQPIMRWKAVVGRLLFPRKAVGPTLRHLRSILRVIRGRRKRVRLEAVGEAREDLMWWHEVLEMTPQVSISRKLLSASVTADASNAGLGYVLEIQGQPTVKGQIQQAGGEDHINRRELLAFQRAVEENAEALEGGKMVWYVDNSMVAIIRKQGIQHIAV